VDTAETWRGGQESLLRLAQGLRARGYRQSIVCPPASVLAERARAEGFPALKSGLRTADIVHAHSGRAQNIAYWETVGSNVRRVATRHVAFPPKYRWLHRLKYTRTCHGIIAVSGAVRQTLIDAGVPARKIETIYTGIEIPGPVTRDRSRWGLSDNDFVIGHMGAFTAEKGQDVAMQAAILLRDILPAARMVLAGEGPELQKLAQDVPDNVLLPGFVSDRAAFFAALDVFIMPSRSEAWGLAALEAMAHGVPVIASNIGGLPEILEDGNGGWLVAPGDPAALARAITYAAADPDRLRHQAGKARDRARLFSIERMVEQTEAFYQRLLRRG
jgi:glycosyltransferase involved in cell wall biosynthesis